MIREERRLGRLHCAACRCRLSQHDVNDPSTSAIACRCGCPQWVEPEGRKGWRVVYSEKPL